tara:strand:- start:2234 stop:4249 length:2016 start_codon:yes stop_codon:yes gene_type:complete
MATTFVDYTGDGNATKAFSFPSIQESDIKVTVDEVLKSSGTHYNITGYTTTGGGNVVFTSGNIPASPAAIRIFRDTNVDAAKATYTAGSSVKAEDLNNNQKQLLFAVQEEQNIVSSTQTVKGFISAADKVKLDGIETAATADQTAAEIRTLVESATDSNVFTDADHTKLNAIESGATGDQTNAEIRAAVEAATDSNVFTDADHAKLDGIAAGAEVNVQADFNATSGDAVILNKPSIPSTINDLTDVNTSGVANGKILKYDSSTSQFIIADDTGGGGGSGSSTFTGLSDTPSNFGGAAGKTVKVNSAGNALEFVTVTAASSDVVDDTSPQLGGNLDVQANQITTSTTNGNIKVNPNGTGCLEVLGDGTSSGTVGAIQLNCSVNSHGVKIQSPPHSAGSTYTLTLPTNIVNGQFLKTDGSGNLSWAAVDLTALSASNLTSGTIPDARFPATLPAVSGANLTNLPASPYNIQINTLSSSSGAGGGSATFNGSATRFTLSNAGANAQAHIVSVNGVIQKPNSGTSPSEGFAIDGNDIIFASAPASGSDFFILTLGTAISVGTPSDNTVTAAKIASNAVTNVKIADDTISESKLDIHAAPSGTDKVLGYTANGMEWVVAEAGATGGGTDKIFYENGQTVTTNYTISNNNNAMSAGPITINSGIAVTIGTGENWTIV